MARVSLQSIAKEIGLSVTTVSMALRGQGKLSQATIEKVKETAAKMGYRPDPMLASLASRRFRSGDQALGLPLALLEFKPHPGEEGRPAALYRSYLLEIASALGYSPTVYSIEEMARYDDFTRLLYHRGTVGIIISGQPETKLFENNERWSHFAIVQCGRYLSSLPVHTVRPNIFQAVKLSFEKALERGYRKIGFALGHHPAVLEDDLARFGAALALSEHHLSADYRIPPFFGSFDDMEASLAWFRKFQPEVIIAFSTRLWYALLDAGTKSHDKIGYITLHADKGAQGSAKICSLDQSHDDIAREAVFLIDQMVRHNERGIPAAPKSILVNSIWRDGDTLPTKNQRPKKNRLTKQRFK